MAKFNLWTWFKNIFKNVIKHADQVAITVTEEIKNALNTGAAGFLAGLIDQLTKSHIAENILKFLKDNITKVLAAELAVQGIPDNATPDDILKFETDVINAFGKIDNKSKLYTTLAAQIYGLIDTTLKTTPETPPTFAEWVRVVESAYQDYLQDKQDAENP